MRHSCVVIANTPTIRIASRARCGYFARKTPNCRSKRFLLARSTRKTKVDAKGRDPQRWGDFGYNPCYSLKFLAFMNSLNAIPFAKMHGLGNDFVVINATDPAFPRHCLTSDWLSRLADRHRGVGCDQILLVEKAVDSSHDFFYRIFNSDGSPAGQCGNGARCFALFVYRQGLANKPTLRVGLNHSAIDIERISSADNAGVFRVNMGAPIFELDRIPYLGPPPNAHGVATINITIQGEAHTFELSPLSMGNPHAVLVVPAIDSVPVASWGKALENHPAFPDRVNVSFMKINSPTSASLRVFERGAGETLACGSGACAAVVAGISRGLLRPNTPITLSLPGGTLILQWEGGHSSPVWMQGDAQWVFESVFPC
jgi:diaminopimelate epimerase